MKQFETKGAGSATPAPFSSRVAITSFRPALQKIPDIDTNAVTALEAPPAAVPQTGALFSVFRHRNYRLFFTGQSISLIGFWMLAIAQAWRVYRLTDLKQ